MPTTHPAQSPHPEKGCEWGVFWGIFGRVGLNNTPIRDARPPPPPRPSRPLGGGGLASRIGVLLRPPRLRPAAPPGPSGRRGCSRDIPRWRGVALYTQPGAAQACPWSGIQVATLNANANFPVARTSPTGRLAPRYGGGSAHPPDPSGQSDRSRTCRRRPRHASAQCLNLGRVSFYVWESGQLWPQTGYFWSRRP